MDKIFVNNFVKDVEIGAYQSERGHTQKIRFNVVLEVLEPTKDLQDDVDRVLSYEIILDSINLCLLKQRYNLLETLAEKIAETCLLNTRVYTVHIKVEKLDKIPGTMGISLFRSKAFGNQLLNNEQSLSDQTIDWALFYFSNSVTKSESIKRWIATLKGLQKPTAILLDPLEKNLPKNLHGDSKQRFQLSSIDQNALLFSCLHDSISTASSKSELNSILMNEKISIICPSEFVLRATSKPPNIEKRLDDFVVWFCKELGITKLIWVCNKNNAEIERHSTTNFNVRILKQDDWVEF